MVRVSACKDCHAAIYWLHSAADKTKSMPVNVDMIMGEGNVLADLDAGTYRVLGKQEAAESPTALYLSHFATCPNAKARKKH